MTIKFVSQYMKKGEISNFEQLQTIFVFLFSATSWPLNSASSTAPECMGLGEVTALW